MVTLSAIYIYEGAHHPPEYKIEEITDYLKSIFPKTTIEKRKDFFSFLEEKRPALSSHDIAKEITLCRVHQVNKEIEEFLPLPHVGHLGGLGMMLGLELVVDKETKAARDPDETLKVIQGRAFKEGLYLRVMANRLCFSPPLIITEEEADKAIDRLYPIVAELKL